MAKFKTIITTAGAAKIAAVLAGTASIVLDNTAKMAVGDGNGTLPTPSPAQTKLVKEVHRASINRASIDASDPKNIVAELVIPPETGGFWIREMALYDAAGTLLAVGNMAETYKPSLSEGAGRKMVIRMVIAVSEVSAITITMDTSTVMATQDYVDSEIDKHAKSRNHPDATLTAKGFTQLNSATNSALETQAATPKAVKTVMDATNLKAPIASPALTGKPTAPTAAQTVNDTQIATTAFVKAAVAALINSSPDVLDTLGELAAALGNDANFATTMTNLLALKAPLASPELTGLPTAPTAAAGTSSTQLSTTEFVQAAIAVLNAAVTSALALKAPLASPVLTGAPTAPTAAQTVNNTQIATTAYVKAAVTALVNSSPAALDTLKELADALGNDANFATTMTNQLALKAPLASPALTGAPTAPTAAAGNNTTQLSTTAFVQAAVAALNTAINNALALKAPLSSPALTGTPTAPTAAQTVSNTQIATTAFVKAAVAALVNASPVALDTLKELADALGNDANFAATMTNALADKQPLDSTLTDLSGKNVQALLAYLGIKSAGLRDVGIGANQIPDMSFFAGVKADTGYQKLPSGIIIQWGLAAATIGVLSQKAYPIAFPNAALHVFLTHNVPNDVAGVGLSGARTQGSTTLFDYQIQALKVNGTDVTATASGTAAISMHFLAIGY